MDGKSVGLLGRRRLISKEGIVKMNEDLTNDSLRLQADTCVDFKRRCQEKIGQARGWNSFVPTDSIPISAKTISSYIQEGSFTIKKGQVKNSGRSEAYLNIRNPIACAAVFTSLEREVDFENLHSYDDVSILLNGWENKVLYLMFSIVVL